MVDVCLIPRVYKKSRNMNQFELQSTFFGPVSEHVRTLGPETGSSYVQMTAGWEVNLNRRACGLGKSILKPTLVGGHFAFKDISIPDVSVFRRMCHRKCLLLTLFNFQFGVGSLQESLKEASAISVSHQKLLVLQISAFPGRSRWVGRYVRLD